ncbi:MAG: hypothetical protein JWN14_2708 [Chthonomonadales bacterium]|nr:hypothetical protein [Chthonomonadales bacterium]
MMQTIDSIVSKAFFADVAAYAAFLDGWFPPERWTSTEPARPLQSGRLASAEIAYVLLRFGSFYTSDWEEWKAEGFVALDDAILATLTCIKGLLKAQQRAPSAGWKATVATEDEDSLQGLLKILYGERSAQASLYAQYPLLYALAVLAFVNLDRPGTDVRFFCHRLKLIVSCSP